MVIVLHHRRLDAALAPALGDLLGRPLPSSVSRLVLDLRSVDFMDASALGAIVYAFRALDVELVLARPTRRVRQLLETTGLDRLLDLHPSLRSAPGEAARCVSSR